MPITERLFKALHEKNAIQRHLCRRYLFDVFQMLGFHIHGDHFYEIVPNTKLIRRKYCDSPRPLPGIDWHFAAYETRARELITRYGPEFCKNSARFGFRERNHYFRGVDALILYCLLRDLKPEKFVEVGQGFSTRVALAALDQNAAETGVRPILLSIDPYPRFRPDEIPNSIKLELVQSEIQDVTPARVLEDCRFLFVDSSHVCKFGSDASFELSVLYPNVQNGTLVHVHDIFTPYDYPKDWMIKEKRFWNEQYALEWFLAFNSTFEVFLPVNHLVRDSKHIVEAVTGLKLDERFKFAGASFYMKRV